MLKFYYAPISANSRRVWITLLEKQIPFEPIIIDLDGEQFQSEFTAISQQHDPPIALSISATPPRSNLVQTSTPIPDG
jgi:glutathione S-transferase